MYFFCVSVHDLYLVCLAREKEVAALNKSKSNGRWTRLGEKSFDESRTDVLTWVPKTDRRNE